MWQVSLIHCNTQNLQGSPEPAEIASSRDPSGRRRRRRGYRRCGRHSRRTRSALCRLHIFIIEQTPFEGGIFHLRLHFTPEYPSTPPNAFFITKIFHPNIAPRTGEVCVNTLKRDWNSKVTLSEILLVYVPQIGCANGRLSSPC